MESAKFNGTVLEYDVRGAGEPLLLISTGPLADSFLPFLTDPALQTRHRVIAYHQRGQAGSPRDPGSATVTFEEHAADAAALLGHLDIPRAHVAGHSTGAVVALQLAVDRPAFVHSLVLLEPTLPAAPPPPEGFISPVTWGIEANVIERFGKAGVSADKISFVRDTYTFDFPGTPVELVDASAGTTARP